MMKASDIIEKWEDVASEHNELKNQLVDYQLKICKVGTMKMHEILEKWGGITKKCDELKIQLHNLQTQISEADDLPFKKGDVVKVTHPLIDDKKDVFGVIEKVKIDSYMMSTNVNPFLTYSVAKLKKDGVISSIHILSDYRIRNENLVKVGTYDYDKKETNWMNYER